MKRNHFPVVSIGVMRTSFLVLITAPLLFSRQKLRQELVDATLIWGREFRHVEWCWSYRLLLLLLLLLLLFAWPLLVAHRTIGADPRQVQKMPCLNKNNIKDEEDEEGDDKTVEQSTLKIKLVHMHN
jgi:hypothetical protein